MLYALSSSVAPLSEISNKELRSPINWSLSAVVLHIELHLGSVSVPLNSQIRLPLLDKTLPLKERLEDLLKLRDMEEG